ncbi:hypothetical protein GT030_22260 [Streptomyces sp. SID1328]|uniref:hypothetical protein n=1 Tax=Streptomyces sp. SID1328 TaxID=2690250 RepID=UPI001369DD1A|nr:hypothetical protein [Streptomyces sp. SID1328]MYV41515.1 hypothetical protein [Streptomyces sp. SID1328]
MGSAAITLNIRRMDGAVDKVRIVGLARSDALGRTVADVRWHRCQQHYAGTCWSATTQSHALYESRLGLARLLCADFASCIHDIVAQPFLLKAVVDGGSPSASWAAP